MSEPTGTPAPGTAVTAPEPEEPRGVGLLPPEYRAAIQLRKEMNVAAALIAQQNWGKTLDLPMRRAITEFCRTYQIDPATEIYVLGGNLYVNAAFYLRKLGEMQQAGEIEYAWGDFIHKDARLDEMERAGDERAKNENARRKWARIEFDVDDTALSACVFRIKTPKMHREVTGCKAIYTDKKADGKFLDPVGNASPMETVESRAARRAMRKLASHVQAGASQLVQIEEQAERISVTLTETRDRLKQRGPDELEAGKPAYQLGTGMAPVTAAGGGPPLTSEERDAKPVVLNARGERVIEAEVMNTQPAPEPRRGDAFEDDLGGTQSAEDRDLDLKLSRE